MKMELIQPFINSLDSVIAENHGASPRKLPTSLWKREALKRTGIAALVAITGGNRRGRVIPRYGDSGGAASDC